MAVLPCPCQNLKISGVSKAVTRGFATGPDAEDAAIAQARADAEREADQMMADFRCAPPCVRTWKKPTFRVRSSGSQNNPAFPIVGAAAVVWTITATCTRPAPLIPIAKKKPKKKKKPIGPGTNVNLTEPTAPSRYPYPTQIPCGKITIFIAHGVVGIVDGGIVFDFVPTPSELCDCEEFGWIQHVKDDRSNTWRYDNGTHSSIASPHRFGGLSDPTKTVQPTQPPPGVNLADWPGNPWYGAPTMQNPPADFDQHPTPQTRIGDRPGEAGLTFVTQLVCVETGEVLFSWYWGPIIDPSAPLEGVNSGPTPPP